MNISQALSFLLPPLKIAPNKIFQKNSVLLVNAWISAKY